MAEYKKTIILNEPAALRQKLTNWAAFNKVETLDSMFLEEGARFEGKKYYRDKGWFRVRILFLRVGIFFLWIAIGVLVALRILRATLAADPETPYSTLDKLRFLWILPPLGYVAYCFIKKRKGRIVEFEIRSIGPFDGSSDPPTLIITASADFDEVKGDVNSLLMMLT